MYFSMEMYERWCHTSIIYGLFQKKQNVDLEAKLQVSPSLNFTHEEISNLSNRSKSFSQL